jgi:cytochrome c oxidase subunit 1
VIGIPPGLKIFSWLFSLWGSSNNRLNIIESYWIFTFIILFTIGGFTGIMLANSLLDITYHDTWFVVAHFHYVLSLGAVAGIISGFYFYGKLLLKFSWDNFIGKLQCIVFVIGVNLLFYPMHLLGLNGQSRRYVDYVDYYSSVNKLIVFGLFISITSVLLLIYNFEFQLFYCDDYFFYFNKPYFYSGFSIFTLDKIIGHSFHNYEEKPIV